MDLIKAHLGSKMSDADLAGLRVSGLPALPSSSLYSHQQLMYGHGRDTPDMAASQPAINAMFNSYTFKVVKNILMEIKKFVLFLIIQEAAASKRESRNSRNSRNVRGRGRRRDRERRSRKGEFYPFPFETLASMIMLRQKKFYLEDNEVSYLKFSTIFIMELF